MKVASKTWIPLAAALFLAPIIGGQIYVDAMKLEPGASVLSLVMKGAPETPWLSHAYLGIFVVAAAVWMAFSQKVIAIPKIPMAAMMILLGGCLVASISGSSFKLVSFASIAEWLIYLVAFFVAAAVSGRGKGSQLLIGAVVAGCAIVSLMGIIEYGQMRRIDPTWRIFASWVNSNALAGMLLIGLMLGLGLTVLNKRLNSFMFGLATALIGVAIVLTQSRGAIIYALPVGLVFFIVASVLVGGSAVSRALRVAKVSAVLVAVVVLMAAFAISAKKSTDGSSAPTALARVSTQADHAREQSSSFRIMLWKSTLELMQQNPGGYGLGTFRYEGSRPGLVVPTQFAHQSFLQLGAEASPATPAILLCAGLAWLFYMFRGIRKTPFELSAIRIAIVAAVVTSVVHNLFDSDLYHFGIGLTFFALLGIGLSAAADGVSPEFLPTPIRISFPIGAVALVCALIFAGSSKVHLSKGLAAIEEGDVSKAQDQFDWSINTGIDGEASYLKSRIVQDPAERLDLLKQAVSLNPSPKFYRALAREQVSSGNRIGAKDAFGLALKRDPNSLQTLSQLLELYVVSNDLASAKETAERMVAVEQSPSFTIRAISEVVPVQSFEARIYLASLESDKHKVVNLLKPAVEGFIEYVRNTLPRVVQNASADAGGAFAGETVRSAQKAIDAGRLATQKLTNAYRALGDRKGLSEAKEALGQFDEAADSLRSISK